MEKEYVKLEQYINIYSGVALQERGLVIDEKEKKREAILTEFWSFLKEPANRQGLRQLIAQAKEKLNDLCTPFGRGRMQVSLGRIRRARTPKNFF